MNRYVCIHSHFYQPPRENPWLEEIELQDSAYPYHDWNERVSAECYEPNTASRILGSDKAIIDIVDNYSKISFNFGPTLLSWMQRKNPELYKTIIEVDKESQKRFSGHGSAIAQPYNHMIMPLANSSDKRTQIIWGIKDFEYRFGRKPEGMWVPETAVDLETLDIMTEYGIKFTILSQHQAGKVKKIGEQKWHDVSYVKIDPKIPYLCSLPSGRTISIFFYDGPISHDIAFGGLLENGEVFAKRLLGAFSSEHKDQAQIVNIATDGETYGHHHRYGEMALAYCLYYLESNNLAKITIYGEYLDKFPPTHEVQIIENTSWSCVHGVERWKSNCGCTTGTHSGWTQAWRASLRFGMDWLRNSLISLYEKEISAYVKNPWQARNDYVEVILNRANENVELFFSNHAVKELDKDEKIKVLKLLEMQRYAMLMYTSCGWFFEDISGIETVQVIRYAGRAMQLAKEISGVSLEGDYLKIIEGAPSNLSDLKNGAKVYEAFVKPAVVDLLRVGAHYSIFSMFDGYPEEQKIYCYDSKSEMYDREEAGKQKLAIGRVRLRSNITWEESVMSFSVLHLGDHNLNGSVKEFMPQETFTEMHREMKDAFARSNIAEVIRLMDKYFGANNYSLWHLFRDEQREVLNKILKSTLSDIEISFEQIYEYHYAVMHFFHEARIPLPKVLAPVVEFTVNTNLRRLMDSEELELDRLQKLIQESKKWKIEIDKATLGFVSSHKIHSLMEKLESSPKEMALLETLESILKILSSLPLDLNLWEAQNIYFSISKQLYSEMKKNAEIGDNDSKDWLKHFDKLGSYLKIKSA